MPDARKPVTPAVVPMCIRGGCNRPATWVVKGVDGISHTCTAHVGELLQPCVNAVWPIGLEVEPPK
jgi:hypothetical protein